jgi:hypothetical protein
MIKIKTYPITNNLILTNEILGRNSSRVAKFEVLKRSCFITIFITNNKLYYIINEPFQIRSGPE